MLFPESLVPTTPVTLLSVVEGVVPAKSAAVLPPPQPLKQIISTRAVPPKQAFQTFRVLIWLKTSKGNRNFMEDMGWLFSFERDYFIVGCMKVANPFIKHTDRFDLPTPRALKSSMVTIAAVTCLSLSSIAHADWQKVTSTDSGVIYVDDGSMKKMGPIRSFWSLFDYRVPQKAQRGAYYVSTRTHMEMDCRKEMVHILQFSMQSGPMLTGEIIDSQGVMREWQTIPPDTPLVSLFRFVCGK